MHKDIVALKAGNDYMLVGRKKTRNAIVWAVSQIMHDCQINNSETIEASKVYSIIEEAFKAFMDTFEGENV
jgi:hypothetical protein